MDIKKQNNESDNSYIARLYKNKTAMGYTNKRISEIINKELGTNYAESTLRGVAKYYLEGYDDGFEKALVENDNNAILEENKKVLKEIEIKTIQCQDQKREARNFLRIEARWEHLKDEMVKAIKELEEVKPIVFQEPNTIKEEEYSQATLILSDWHLGMINNTSHNYYNIEVARNRAEELAYYVAKYCKRHKVKILNIEIAGDMIHGLIHLGTRVNSEEDSISQTMVVSEILSDLINKISKEVENVNVYGCLGNHSRVSANIKDNIEVENFERIITWYIRARLEKLKNVKIYDNFENDIITYKVFDLNICCVHGHKEKLGEAIDDLSKFKKIFFDELHLGHWHNHKVSTDNNMKTIVNGSFGGSDEYAEDHRKTNKPSQTLIIYNPKGQECIYDISLDC